jgi:plasmid stabilization system protein ParE
MGSARPNIAPDARVLVFGNYLILYRLRGEDTIRIYRVVHGARELSHSWSEES